MKKYIAVFLFYFFCIGTGFANVVLLDFDKASIKHPFDKVKALDGSFQGKLSARKYYNIEPQDLKLKDWNGFQYLELDLYNPNESGIQVFITLGDDESFDYWSQVNYVQTIIKGWNRLSLPLDQLVGERGSVKYNRKIKLNNLKKFFLVIDPDKKAKIDEDYFFIDNVALKKAIVISREKDIYSFDFTDKKRNNNIETEVTMDDRYVFTTDQSKYYGFSEVNFHRAEDSMYAPLGLRSAIGILKGDFKVRVPNGKYRGFIVIDHLGYWDVPFYRDRTIYLQGKPFFKETRNNANEFLKDLLRFENLEVDSSLDVYSEAINAIFKKIPFEVTVTGEELVFSFEGDATGIMLNRLIFYPVSIASAGDKFVSELDKKDRREYAQLMRSLLKPMKQVPKIQVKHIEPDGGLELSKDKKEESIKEAILCLEESKTYFFQLDNGTLKNVNLVVDVRLSPLRSGAVELYELKNQIISPDMNHETYSIGARIFEPISSNKPVVIKAKDRKFFAVRIPAKHNFPSGKYDLLLSFRSENYSKEFQLPIKIINAKLPAVDFPVGFMGMDVLPYSYFSDASYEEIRFQYRKQLLNEIQKSGFTLTTGLPDVGVSYHQSKFKYDSLNLEKTLQEIKKHESLKYILSYGGEFPKRIVDMLYLPQGLSEDKYHLDNGEMIKKILNKYPGIQFVHTYSDEAHGYSNRIDQDIRKGEALKKYYPFLKIGGFTTFGTGKLQTLNDLFDWPFYSDANFKEINRRKSRGDTFGLYNSSQNTMDDPRFTFGVGLFMAKLAGVRSYVEWSSIGFHNYPYFDLDGRESDVVIFYPKKDGSIRKSLRFVLAEEGLNTFRKLHLLEEALGDKGLSKGLTKEEEKIKLEYQKFKQSYYFYKAPKFMAQKDQSIRQIEASVGMLLLDLYK